MKHLPDNHDADLVLKLYDLRREAVMRESRKKISAEFAPKSFDDLKAVMAPTHPMNAALRQVVSYWEMAYGFCRHGVLHADLLAESSGEGMLMYAKIQPFLAEMRAATSPTALQNCEWMVENSEVAKRQFEIFRKRLSGA